MTYIARYKTLLFIIGALVLWSLALYVVSPESLIERIGLENSYLVSFAVAFLAGFSSFTGAAAYATVIEFSKAGAEPLLLGLASGVGLFLSDSVFYILIYRGRESVETQFQHLLSAMQAFFTRVPDPVVYFVTYVFCALGPIPNDIIVGALVLAGYRYRKFWLVLLLGDVTFMLFLSYLFN